MLIDSARYHCMHMENPLYPRTHYPAETIALPLSYGKYKHPDSTDLKCKNPRLPYNSHIFHLEQPLRSDQELKYQYLLTIIIFLE